jgi:hypothetical protein
MTRKHLWILLGVGALITLGLIITANALSVGRELSRLGVWVEYAFYALIGLFILIFILRPIHGIVVAPPFKLPALDDESARQKTYVRALKKLQKLEYMSAEDKASIETALTTKKELEATTKAMYQGPMKKEMDAIIIFHAKTIMTTTALSQNGSLDMLAVIATNLKMISKLVKATGYRPSYVNLSKLAVNVTVTAMIAEGLEDIDISEWMPSKLGETISDVPLLRGATNSMFQGLTNGLLALRIGIITRRFLFQDRLTMTPKQLRIAAYKESFTLMPKLIKEGVFNVPRSFIQLLSKVFKKPSESSQNA